MALRKKNRAAAIFVAARNLPKNAPNVLKVLKVPNDLKAFISLFPYALFRLL